MTDIYRSFSFYHLIKTLIDFVFCNRVQRRSRFIHNYKRCVFVKRACNCNFLGFTTTDFYTVFIIILVKRSIKTFFHFGKTHSKTSILQTFNSTVSVVFNITGNIFAKRKTEQIKILEYYCKKFCVFFVIIITDIYTIKQNLSFGWFIQTTKKLYKGCFTRTVFSNNSIFCSKCDFLIYMTQSPGIGICILKRNITEFNFKYIVITLLGWDCSVVSLVFNFHIIIEERKITTYHFKLNKVVRDSRNAFYKACVA